MYGWALKKTATSVLFARSRSIITPPLLRLTYLLATYLRKKTIYLREAEVAFTYLVSFTITAKTIRGKQNQWILHHKISLTKLSQTIIKTLRS